jgi:dimeric dUTPase (all-alpha-NTP-PPase superfamily)
MNIEKLFEAQRFLDADIVQKHPELKGQDNLEWKVLALQVELGECANEWRGFKKWSNDQQPRIKKARGPYVSLEDAEFYNPLLEEYVDCLHFILSIGLEKGYEQRYFPFTLDTIPKSFIYLMQKTADFYEYPTHGNYGRIIMVFLGLGELLGFTLEQIEQAYYEKNAINLKRQAEGY